MSASISNPLGQVAGTATPASNSSAATNAASLGALGDPNVFLKLLVAQL